MQFLELPRMLPAASGAGVQELAGTAAAGLIKPGVTHPYFVGAQFHPELTSRPLRPQPMFMGLIAAVISKKWPTIDPRDPWAAEIKRWTPAVKRAAEVVGV
jgi:hypothetical protein